MIYIYQNRCLIMRWKQHRNRRTYLRFHQTKIAGHLRFQSEIVGRFQFRSNHKYILRFQFKWWGNRGTTALEIQRKWMERKQTFSWRRSTWTGVDLDQI